MNVLFSVRAHQQYHKPVKENNRVNYKVKQKNTSECLVLGTSTITVFSFNVCIKSNNI